MENYPIKYGIAKLLKQAGEDEKGKAVYHTDLFVPMLCYVINEFYDRRNNIEYEVVFIRNNIARDFANTEIENQTPCFDEDDNCTNSIIIKELFEDFEDAELVCNGMNEELFYDITPNSKIKEGWLSFTNKINHYYNLSYDYGKEIAKKLSFR